MTIVRAALAAALATSLFATPLAVEAQWVGKVYRIGFLSPSSPSDARNPLRLGALRQALRELGYVDGQNISIESQWAEGKYDRLSGLAAELVKRKMDVIVTYTAPAIQAAKQATATIPIVMGGVIDPVASGVVTSLARPGGNITGLSFMAAEPVAKQLEIIKEVLPKVRRVAVLGNPDNLGTAPQLRYAQDTARALGVRLQLLETRSPGEIDSAFTAMTRHKAGAVIVLVDAMLEEHRTRIVHLAARRRLPSVFGLVEFVEAGGLMFYGASDTELFRRAAIFVDKILKGATPGDLPIEQPTKFELVINMKTARALGLPIPQLLLLRADQVID